MRRALASCDAPSPAVGAATGAKARPPFPVPFVLEDEETIVEELPIIEEDGGAAVLDSGAIAGAAATVELAAADGAIELASGLTNVDENLEEGAGSTVETASAVCVCADEEGTGAGAMSADELASTVEDGATKAEEGATKAEDDSIEELDATWTTEEELATTGAT